MNFGLDTYAFCNQGERGEREIIKAPKRKEFTKMNKEKAMRALQNAILEMISIDEITDGRMREAAQNYVFEHDMTIEDTIQEKIGDLLDNYFDEIIDEVIESLIYDI